MVVKAHCYLGMVDYLGSRVMLTAPITWLCRITVSTMSENLKGVILRLIAVGIGSEVTSLSLSFSSDLDGLVSDLRIWPFSVAA